MQECVSCGDDGHWSGSPLKVLCGYIVCVRCYNEHTDDDRSNLESEVEYHSDIIGGL